MYFFTINIKRILHREGFLPSLKWSKVKQGEWLGLYWSDGGWSGVWWGPACCLRFVCFELSHQHHEREPMAFFFPCPEAGGVWKCLGLKAWKVESVSLFRSLLLFPSISNFSTKPPFFFFHHHLLFNSFPFSPFFPIFHQMHSCPSHIGLHVTKSNIQVSVLILLDHPAVFDVSEDLILLDTISSVLVTPRSPVFLLFPWLLFSVTFTWYTSLSDLKILESVRTLPSFLFYVDPSATADIAAICDFKDLYAGESLCLHIDISYNFQV